MRRPPIFVLIACLVSAALLAPAAEPEPKKPSIVMEKKLEYSQDMLKALVNDDFARLDRDVKLMEVFTRLEEMYRAKRPDYQDQLAKFKSSLSMMSKAVEQTDHDAAAEAYGTMVQSCIRCHQIIRSR